MDVDKRDRRERQMDRGERPPRTESEERRRREKRREREERHRREKERVQNGGKPRRPFRNLDLIDKLDVTGVYGQGCEFSFTKLVLLIRLTDYQYFITMVPSMLVDQLETRKETGRHRYKPSQRAQ